MLDGEGGLDHRGRGDPPLPLLGRKGRPFVASGDGSLRHGEWGCSVLAYSGKCGVNGDGT